MRQLRAMLHLGGPPRDGWEPPIVPAPPVTASDPSFIPKSKQ